VYLLCALCGAYVVKKAKFNDLAVISAGVFCKESESEGLN